MSSLFRLSALCLLFTIYTPLFADPILITHDQFVEMVKPNTSVRLPAGAIVQLEQGVYIPSGVTITTDPDDPATIIMNPEVSSALSIQGERIKIENIRMDFDMRGEWRAFRSLIAFKIPAWTGLSPDSPIRDIRIVNVTFINSSPPEDRKDPRDSWAIDFAHNSPESLKDIVVTGCTQLAKWVQLSGNGQGIEGVDGLYITHNLVVYGRANSIAYSSSTQGSVIKNVIVAYNTILNALGIGIFLGQDGSHTDYNIGLYNVIISDNWIHMDRESGDFPHCVATRATAPTQTYNPHIVLARNVCNATDASGHVRWATLYGAPEDPGTYMLDGNIQVGQSYFVTNMTEVP